MKFSRLHLLSFLSLFATIIPLCGPDVHADDRDPRGSFSSSRLNDTESTVSQAASVYRALTKNGKVPAAVLNSAKCIAVFPEVMSAAIAVGGVHGDGVAFCRESGTKGWGNPVFLNLTGGTLGVQLGAKTSDIVLFMNGDKARQAIKEGDFTLSGELSAVAGKFDETVQVPRSGVVAYSQTSGIFAGASLGALSISHDKDEQRAYYGTYDRNSIFEGKMPPEVERSVRELKDLLPA